MEQYLSILRTIMYCGVDREGRNGKTRALFAVQFRHDMQTGFPLLTTKKVWFKGVVAELLWFLSGSRNLHRLAHMLKVPAEKMIWHKNATDFANSERAQFNGDVGRIYGQQWRNWGNTGNEHTSGGIDQIRDLINRLKKDPTDRRLIVTAWNPSDLEFMCLPSCHILFQLFGDPETHRLSLHMVQRSCDMFLGVPWNIASYGLLLSMIAQTTGMIAHELIITFNDAHIYHGHFDQVKEQLGRTPKPLPRLGLNDQIKDIDDFTMEDIAIFNYDPDPTIKAEMYL